MRVSKSKASFPFWAVVCAAALPALLACARSSRPAPTPQPVRVAAAPSASSVPAALPKGHVWRSQVMAVMSPGMGAFLQRISVRESLIDGKFQGFIVEELRGDPKFWNDVDLRPGDLVTAVNGQAIGHYSQAYRVWQSLATASELVVSFARAGVARELRYVIHDQPGTSMPQASASAAPALSSMQ